MKCTTGGTGRVGAWIAAAAVAVAAPLGAQEGGSARIADIEKIEAAAAKQLASDGDWSRAAALFREAAGLRPAGDATAVADLLRAGRIAFYEGRERQAVRDFEAAGERALERGDVIGAADAFTDAAWVARADGRRAEANALLARAQLLANSPLLERGARDRLRARWGVAGAL